MTSPHQVTRDFEKALCDYTGAKYAVTTTSCTMALLIAVAWHLKDRKKLSGFCLPDAVPYWSPQRIEIPKHTYIGVPMSIIHAGGRPVFRDEEWSCAYQLKPLPVWDSARWFTSGMYRGNCFTHPNGPRLPMDNSGQMICVSFHVQKTLGDTQGGAILHDNTEADEWLRRARFDGRAEGVAPKDDTFKQVGYHCYLSPDVSTRLLWRLGGLPRHNPPLPWGPGTDSDYPDLSEIEIFK